MNLLTLGVHFIVLPGPAPGISPMMQSRAGTIDAEDAEVAVDAVDPVEDKLQCLVLLELRSRHPH